MKLARPQLRHLRGTVDSSDNSSSNSNNKNSSSKMPPSFADLTSAEAVKSKSDSNSGHRSKKSKKKEKSTHKRHSSSNDATFSSNNKPSRSSHRTSASTLPTIYAGNRESLNNVDTPSQQLDRSTNSSSACSSNNDLKMPANTAMTETEKAQHRRRSEQQDAFVPAQLNVKSKKNKKKSSPSVSSSSNSHRKSSKKKSTLSSKTSSTLTTETNTEWEDLGDEIATALHKSLGVGDDDDDDDEVSNTNDKKQKKGDKQQHRHLEEDIDLPPWKCPACTFKNEPLHLVCAVCGTAAAAVAASLTKSLTSSASSHNQQQLRSSHLSSSFQANNAIPSSSLRSSTHTHHHRYGSSENLNNSTNAEFRRSTFEGGRRHGSSEDFNRYYNDSSSNNHNGSYNNSYNANSGGEYPDPHTSHRGMSNGTAGRSGRYSMDDMSNDSEGLSYNIQDQVDYQDHYHSQRRRSRDYYGRNSFDRRDTRGGGDRGEGGGRSRGFSQSMQIVGSGGGGGGSHYGGGSVGSDRRKQQYKRSRRRTDHFYDDDSKDLASKNSRDEYRMSTKDFRKSTMMDMDYGPPRYDRERSGGSSIGRYRGSGGGRHRDDYSDASESFGTKGRITGGQYYDDGGSIISEMSDDEGTYAERTVRTMQTIKKMVIPSGEVTIIYTDVQGSTALWEADPMSMKKATDIHDSIIRRCYSDHGGYEITTEGDAFNLAFQHPADAIGFALKAQLALYRAKWPEGTLNHPDGCDNEKKKFRGFRVRFGMHHGPTTSTVHKTTGRTTYQGEAVEVAKAIEKMSHGGQILTTVETWRTVSGMAEQLLGSPQVMDCGEHLLWDPKKSDLAKKKSSSKKVLSKRIVQLVPNSLSYDFFAARGGQEVKEGETPQKVCGRVFPPLLSHGQLSTSFLNAPYIGNKVAMVFVYTDKMEAIGDRERKKNYKILAKYVRSHLMRLSPPGYECQEDKGSWMLAFDRIDNGINFGLDLKENVMKNAKLLGEVDKSKVFRVGIHWGPFLSMGPHTVTGHADYFGPIVNRAARVAAQCEAGQICVGVPMGTEEEPPDPGPTVEVDVLGVKQLKGISIEMAIFACRKKEKEEESQEQE
ncbi:hypothetical protein ACHAWT_001979 [Skeletonema menzelii]